MTDVLQVGPLIPAFPPEWADLFGEDAFGVFAELELNGIRFVWRWIPPGRFQMGSPKSENGRFGNEGPMHEVTLTRGFWLGETPVTQEQWEVVSGANPSHFKGEQKPVESVSWQDCQEFIAKLNAICPGLFASLPTEAQWEYACRSGKQTPFNDGSDCTNPIGKDPALVGLAWFDENSGSESHDVKRKRCNGRGLYDMHGNVWEWCRDGVREYKDQAEVNPIGKAVEGAVCVARGGAWICSARGCRSACRDAAEPGIRWDALGLRLAAGQPPEAGSGLGAAEPPGAERPAG